MNTILIKTSFIGKDGYYCNEDMAFKLNKICNVKNITFKIESEIIKTED